MQLYIQKVPSLHLALAGSFYRGKSLEGARLFPWGRMPSYMRAGGKEGRKEGRKTDKTSEKKKKAMHVILLHPLLTPLSSLL